MYIIRLRPVIERLHNIYTKFIQNRIFNSVILITIAS